MSGRERFMRAKKWAKEQPWGLYATQVAVLVRGEVRRNLFSRRRLWVYLLALIPVFILLTHSIFAPNSADSFLLENDTLVLAGIVQLYYVRLGIFFACMGIFTWLFRGEMVERTLHYQLLVPVRREVLVVGKFVAGAIIAILLFEASILTCFYLTYRRFGAAGRSYIFDGPGFHQLGAYLLVTALTCIGYGSVFLALSLLFKNPIVPGLVLMGWETIAPIFPAWAQRLSVTSYLRHLCPVKFPASGPLAIFTVIAEPVPPILAILGLLCLSVVVLVVCCLLINRLEITYTTE
jgi:ABC-type transport system involved in multi-copper enzyme maturation permease subunit